MIPYFEFHVIPLGPIPIQVWGLFVALGILAAAVLLNHVLKRDGLDKQGKAPRLLARATRACSLPRGTAGKGYESGMG